MFWIFFDLFSYIGYKNGLDYIYRDILKKGNFKDFEVFLNDCEI